MNASERAGEVFAAGCNCAQSVFLGCAGALPEPSDLSEDQMLRVASCFGGGMSHTDHACGALTGGLMALGAAEGMRVRGDAATKQRSADLGARFVHAFRDRHGSTRCTELIGYNLAEPEEAAAAKRAGVFSERCAKIVKESAQLVERLLME